MIRHCEIIGTDEYGRPKTERIAVDVPPPPGLTQRLKHFLMRLTPWWAWNALWYRFGLTKIRMVTKIEVNHD